MSRLRIVVMGAAGQLGGAVMQEFATHDVMGFTRQDVELTNHRAVLALVMDLKPDVLINCAAYNRVDDAEDDVQQEHDHHHEEGEVEGDPLGLEVAVQEVGAVPELAAHVVGDAAAREKPVVEEAREAPHQVLALVHPPVAVVEVVGEEPEPEEREDVDDDDG